MVIIKKSFKSFKNSIMTTEKFVVDTQEKAVSILMSYGEPIADAGAYKNVKVGNISKINGKTGEPFVWENSGEPYAIVNLRVISIDGYKQAITHMKDDEFVEATNQALSFNASHEMADRLLAIGRANIVVDLVDSQADDDGNTEEVLRVVDARPVVMEKVKKANLDSLMALINGTEEESEPETKKLEEEPIKE